MKQLWGFYFSGQSQVIFNLGCLSDIDGFKGLVLSDECHQLEVRLSQKRRDLTKLKRDAKESSQKKCQEYINKVDDLTDKLEKGGFEGYFEDSDESMKYEDTIASKKEEKEKITGEFEKESDDDLDFDME